MNNVEFRKHLGLLHDLEIKTLSDKAKDYSTADERLANFYEAGEFNKQDPVTALWGMVTKHIIALRDYVLKYEDSEDFDVIPAKEWYEKLGDIRNYMYLLSAILYDQNPDYKEYFNERTANLPTMQATLPTQEGRKRGGKVS